MTYSFVIICRPENVSKIKEEILKSDADAYFGLSVEAKYSEFSIRTEIVPEQIEQMDLVLGIRG
jgi:hypothetical protein